MKCGERVEVIDWNGAVSAIATAQCGGSFLVIVHNLAWNTWNAPFRNGELLYGWRALLDRLVWLIGHPVDKDQPAFAYSARSAHSGRYAQVLLQNVQFSPVRASELAVLLDAPADEVRARLHDYLVVPEPVGESEGDHASESGDPPPALG